MAWYWSIPHVQGLSRDGWRTGTRPFWHGGATSCGSCATGSGWLGCDSAMNSGLAWLGGGIGRSAVAGGRNGGIVGNEVTPSVRGTDGVTLLSTLPPSFRAIMEPNMIPKRCQNDLTIIAYLNYTVPHWLEMNYTVPYVVLVAFAIIGVWHTVWHLVKNTSAVAWFHDWVFGLLDDPTKPAPIRRWSAARRWGRGC